MKHCIFRTREAIDKLIRQYTTEGRTGNSLAKEYGVDPSTIRETLKRHGIEVRNPQARRTANEAFFETIDTEAKAYFLGLMMADGCVTQRKGRCSTMQMDIALQARDRHILDTFVKEIEFTGRLFFNPISKRHRIRNNRFDRYEKQDVYSLRISSSRLCADLIRHGCVRHKTKYLEWLKPETVPEGLMHHFVRGYLDGDGWTSWRKPRAQGWKWTLVLGFCGTRHFIAGLAKYLTEAVGIRLKNVTSSPGMTKIDIVGSNESNMVVDYLYRDATIWLKRKRDDTLLPRLREGRYLTNTESPAP